MTLRRVLVTLTTTAALSLFSAGAVAATPLSVQEQTADPPGCSAQVSGDKPKLSAEADQNVARQMTKSAENAVRSEDVHTHVSIDDIDLSHPTVHSSAGENEGFRTPFSHLSHKRRWCKPDE
jgi:hypothetical protein